MGLDRRSFLTGAALGVGATQLAAAQAHAQTTIQAPTEPVPPPASLPPPQGMDWPRVRQQFVLSPDWVDMSAMLIASHPKMVREAIERHRQALDANPVLYLEPHNRRLQNAARDAAGRYFGMEADHVALTDSTTMGVALVYNGLRLRPGQEILTTHQDYYVTHESLRLAAERSGAQVRRFPLYDRLDGVTKQQIVDRVMGQISPRTRVLALTWVLSSTGLKTPIPEIGRALKAVNAGRSEEERVLLCVDGVHGFGNQDVTMADLGADFFVAGCHKWIFGPRGTGVIYGSDAGWKAAAPTIPTFLDSRAYSDWINGAEPKACSGSRMTPGGFKAFEHLWAISDAFALHSLVGKRRVADRTAELATRLKQGLASMPHVTLQTPMSPELSAGIVSFDVAGMSPHAVVDKLRGWKVIGSVAPYARQHVRLTPSIRNFPEEIDFVLNAIDQMKA